MFPLTDYLTGVYTYLSDFALSHLFWANFESIYGTEYDFAKAETIRSGWASSDFSDLPPIEVVSAEVLGSALGGYGASNNTIYLSELLFSFPPEKVVAVLLEEIGHYVDAQVNVVDTAGDEGKHFSVVALGGSLLESELTRIKAENDLAVISIQGESVEIEQANLTVNFGEGYVNNNGEYFYVNDGESIQSSGVIFNAGIIDNGYEGTAYIYNGSISNAGSLYNGYEGIIHNGSGSNGVGILYNAYGNYTETSNVFNGYNSSAGYYYNGYNGGSGYIFNGYKSAGGFYNGYESGSTGRFYNGWDYSKGYLYNGYDGGTGRLYNGLNGGTGIIDNGYFDGTGYIYNGYGNNSTGIIYNGHGIGSTGRIDSALYNNSFGEIYNGINGGTGLLYNGINGGSGSIVNGYDGLGYFYNGYSGAGNIYNGDGSGSTGEIWNGLANGGTGYLFNGYLNGTGYLYNGHDGGTGYLFNGHLAGLGYLLNGDEGGTGYLYNGYNGGTGYFYNGVNGTIVNYAGSLIENRAGSYILNNGIINNQGTFSNFGTLAGSGTFIGDLIVSAGTLAPGGTGSYSSYYDTDGAFTIQGNFTQSSAAILQLNFTNINSFDVLKITGDANIDGGFQLGSLSIFANSFFNPGETDFVIVDGDSDGDRIGTLTISEGLISVLDSVVSGYDSGNLDFSIVLYNNDLVLRVINDINNDPPNVVTNTNDSGPGSLRAAIEWANSNPGTDGITFNIPGSGVQTINLLSALPEITESIIIDGRTQPGFTNSPLIELNGASAGPGVSGLSLFAGYSVIQGLIINRFSDFGIYISGNGNNTIQGNYIGTDATGSIDLGNGNSGIYVESSPNNLIGGYSEATRNIISGNNNGGINISFDESYSNQIVNNYIGLNATGTAAIGNSGWVGGVTISNGASSNYVYANVISGNGLAGVNGAVFVQGENTTNNQITGNYIGTDATGTLGLGNLSNGISIADASHTSISQNVISGNGGNGISLSGSTATDNIINENRIGMGINTVALGNTSNGINISFGASNNTISNNLIAYNARGIASQDVYFPQATQNRITQNSIYSNIGLGIDSGSNGVTPNDPGDGDNGFNLLQNYPILTTATSSNGQTTVTGTLNSSPNSYFTLEFFTDNALDSSGYGEGGAYLGSVGINTDSDGNASFSVAFSLSLPSESFITATATDLNNNTSEFSQGVVVSQNSAPTDIDLSNTSVNENVGTYREIGIFNTTDPDTGDTFTYELVSGEGDTDNNAFLIADYFSDGQIRLVNSTFINYEQKSSYRIRVRTTDQGGLSYEKVLTITVNDQDDPVVISGPSWDNLEIIAEDPIYPGLVFSSANGNAITLSDEDDPNGDQAIYTIDWDFMLSPFGGGGEFSLGQPLLNNRGTLSEINAALEGAYFTPNSNFNGDVILSIYVKDEQGNPFGDVSPGIYIPVHIRVTPVNDAPELMLGFSSLDWNEGSQYQEFFYGSDVDNYDGSGSYTELTYSAQLNNGNPLPDWLTFSSGSFNGTLIGTPPPGSAGSLEIAVTVSDGELSDTEIFTLNIISTNTAPIITSGNTATFAENKTGVVYTALATDAENDSLTFSLSGTDAGLFNINSATGVVSFKNAPDFENPLDEGKNNVYDITVIANDGTVNSSPQAVAITVTDQAVFAINDVSVNEGAGNANFTVTMTDPLASGKASVKYATANDTAFATPFDYTATSGTLAFNAGDTSKTIQVAINDDLFYEPTPETFFVNLSSPSSNATISKAQGIGTIIDNDTQTTISVSDASVVEGNSGTKNLMFRIDLSAPSGQIISVDYFTGDGGTATEGSDYTAVIGSVTFQPGATTQFVYVPIIGDADTESDETLFLELSDATGGATISRAMATGTIINDDNLTGGLVLTGTDGNDILTGVSTDDTLIGGLGADQLNGAGGADIFRYNALNESLLAGRDSIVSFNPDEGDRIDLPTVPTAAFFVGTMGSSISQAVVTSAYSNAGLAANQAVFFGTGSGRTARLYLSVNDGTAGFNSATDLVMEVSRMVGAPTVPGSLIPNNYFV